MTARANLSDFEKLVTNKFNVYNSLFLNLPFRKVSNIGMLIPLLQQTCSNGLRQGETPVDILDSFFNIHAGVKSEEEKIDFMFRVIQYVERQIVLFDSIEDAAFSQVSKDIYNLSLTEFLHLSESRKAGADIRRELSTFSTRIVLTAHPTQFYTPAVLDIISRLRTFITENDINNIDLTLQQLGLTSLVNLKKPTPLDEARNIIYYLRNVYYDAIGDFYAQIKKITGTDRFDHPGVIKLGFWPGGDRDGNPYVTSETTRQVADELRMTLMKCYYQDIKSLEQKLTFRDVESIIIHLRDRVYRAMFDTDVHLTAEEILEPLLLSRANLVSRYNSLYLDELDRLIDKVKIFRTHFASLDIRQHHQIHENTIREILKKKAFLKKDITELSKEELISILLNDDITLDPQAYDNALIRDTILNIGQLKDIQRKNGEEGCNRYIISNSEDIYSVLYVYALLRWSYPGEEALPFDIIPLFESMEGMANAESIMRELFEKPAYRTHLRQRQDKQTIMLGFSDGTKDGGYLQANWSIFKTKEVLSAVCKEYGIKPVFFDGRGGPPARGGGKSHQFYAAQTNQIANHEIQMTIQGQTITSKYGTKEHFTYNVEQLLTAGLSNRIFGRDNTIRAEQRQLIEELARISYKKYEALKKHALFISYLENKSTLKYYGETNIGSRPTTRGDKSKLEFEDLRAIPFVGSWSQLKQNVPGYFGIGTAIKQLSDSGRTYDVKDLFQQVPFFRTLILNSMMSLSKSNFDLTRYISQDATYKDFWTILHDEYLLSREMVLLVSGYDELMEEEAVTRKSIDIREKIVLPLLVIQQYALQKVESNTPHRPVYEKMVRRSLYGNINASRNSA